MTRATAEGMRYLVYPDDDLGRLRRFAHVVGRAPTRAELNWLRRGWVPGTLR